MNECIPMSKSCHPLSREHTANLTEEALALAQKGFSILPLHSINHSGQCSCLKTDCSSPGKHPIVKHGVKDASKDENIITIWWQSYPNANIGIATGKISNLVVLDIDEKNDGYRSLEKLEHKHGKIQTLEARSGGGGKHFYFLAPSIELKNRTNILPGVDFRSENGYIVAPPSRHISGLQYSWLNNLEISYLPEWLLSFVQKQKQEYKQIENDSIPIGNRNSTLTSIAGYFKTKGFQSSCLERLLLLTNQSLCNPPLDQEEVYSVLKSIENYDSWISITPLEESNSQLVKMDRSYLPAQLAPWIEDVTERMQVPLEYVAIPTIVALSSLIGRTTVIKPLKNDDWTVIPNLWGLLVAEPGSMKSAAMQQAFAPLNELEKKARKEYQRECKEFAKQQKNLALEIDTLKQALKLDWGQGLGQDIKNKQDRLKSISEPQNEQPREKRYKTNDPTIEKLALIMQDNPQGILLLRDEISGWLESLSKSGREGSREFYLEAWNGNGSFSIDRIGRGTTFTESVCLSIFGGIQPDKLKKYMDRYEASCGNDGFLERFQLMVYPDPRKTWEFVDKTPNEEAKNDFYDVFERLDKLDYNDHASVELSFSEKAQNIFHDWRKNLEKKLLNPELSDLKKSYLSKYRSLLPSLALIFQLVEPINNTEVSEESIQKAIIWCELLESHIDKTLGLSISIESYAKVLLSCLQDGIIYSGMNIRELYRKKPKGIKTPKAVKDGIRTLEKHGYLKIIKEKGLGGQSETIFINPAFEGGSL